MILYLVKSTLLLAVLWLLYKLLLENEKMHRFNRFFLLFALVFGLTAPLITFEISPNANVAGIQLDKVQSVVNKPAEVVAESVEPLIRPAEATPAVSSTATSESAPTTAPDNQTPVANASDETSGASWFTVLHVLTGLYSMVTLLLLLRFVAGLFEIRRKIGEGKKVFVEGAHVVLLDEAITPQSFFKYIFLNRAAFESGEVEEEILQHELTHVRHWHSVDVFISELLKVVFWFNPLMYLFKYSIQLNHEFQADEFVVKQSEDVTAYQQLLIKACGKKSTSPVTSSIGFGLTRKRLNMMPKQASLSRSVPKQSVLITLVLSVLFVFCTTNSNTDPLGDFGYYDVKLDSQWEEDMGFIYYDSEGNLYTGIRNFYYHGVNFPQKVESFEHGRKKNSTYYSDSGELTLNMHTISYEKHSPIGSDIKTSFISYDRRGNPIVENLEPYHSDSSIGYRKEWFPNGVLKSEVYWDSLYRYQGIVTLRDSTGQIQAQERYNNGELVEKIK